MNGEDVPVPSVEWLRYQFAPRSVRSPGRFTGALNVKRMIQRRQLHLNHIDNHYANAVFRFVDINYWT